MIEDNGTRDGDLLLILCFFTKVLSKLKSVEARGEVKTQKIASMVTRGWLLIVITLINHFS